MSRLGLPARIQRALGAVYGVDAPDVTAFIRPVEGDARERILVQADEDGVLIELELPARTLEQGAEISFDELCQVVEGVSHFLVLAERARRELPVTQLELELQAEVDKYLVLLGGVPSATKAFPRSRSVALRGRLYDRVAFRDPVGTECGDRYRLANDLAASFACRLEARMERSGYGADVHRIVRRFYDAGQEEKLGLARAA